MDRVEMAIDILTKPTPAESERLAAGWRRREADRRERVMIAHERLAEVTDPVARAVLDLHRENGRGQCEGDEFGGWDGERPDWPCDTVRAVAKAVGIEMPDL
jgi:hypothetical protein